MYPQYLVMKSNKDENETLKIKFEAKMKKIKAICCIIFLDWRYLLCYYWNFIKKLFFRNLQYRKLSKLTLVE